MVNVHVRVNNPNIKVKVTPQDNIAVVNYARNVSPTKLGDLADVDVMDPFTNAFLVYHANNQVWAADSVVVDGGEF
jgi:hypothetical protein